MLPGVGQGGVAVPGGICAAADVGDGGLLLTGRGRGDDDAAGDLLQLLFLVLHFVQFWAKMQLPEMMGEHVMRGQDYLSMNFSQLWVAPVYIVGFVALWFHLTHGFWSAFQSLGTTNDKWIERFKCIGFWWATIVMLLFVVEVLYFTWFFGI